MSEVEERQGRQPDGSFVTSEPSSTLSLDPAGRRLTVAEMNVREAVDAAGKLDEVWPQRDHESAMALLRAESSYSVRAVCASASAMDAFYASVKDHIQLPKELVQCWENDATSLVARMIETFWRGFTFEKGYSRRLEESLRLLFSLRDKAVHPLPETGQPMHHPRLDVTLPWPFVVFREENARSSYGEVLSLVGELSLRPRPKYECLNGYCSTLREQITPLLADWECRYGACHKGS